MPVSEHTDTRRQRKATEVRHPDFIVRAKTGPGNREWSTVGVAWNRDKGEGISVKLHSMPIGPHWNGVLKLLPPLSDDDGGNDDPGLFPQ